MARSRAVVVAVGWLATVASAFAAAYSFFGAMLTSCCSGPARMNEFYLSALPIAIFATALLAILSTALTVARDNEGESM